MLVREVRIGRDDGPGAANAHIRLGRNGVQEGGHRGEPRLARALVDRLRDAVGRCAVSGRPDVIAPSAEVQTVHHWSVDHSPGCHQHWVSPPAAPIAAHAVQFGRCRVRSLRGRSVAPATQAELAQSQHVQHATMEKWPFTQPDVAGLVHV